jgi:hypothetical protein
MYLIPAQIRMTLAALQQILLASPARLVFALFLLVRVSQRVYYLCNGHRHYFDFAPRDEIRNLWKEHNIKVVSCHTTSSGDGVELYYQRVGSGDKVIYHSNGVGTDFFLWLFFMRYILHSDPAFFDKYTILAVTHRGLFVSDEGASRRVSVTLQHCSDDVLDVMRHAGEPGFQ